MVIDYDITDIRKSGTFPGVSVNLLNEIPLPPAGNRTRWHGVKHGDLIATLGEQICNAGLQYSSDTWTLMAKGERLFGYISVSLTEKEFEWTKKTLSLPDEIKYENFAFKDIDLRMGLRHSNDSSTALYLMVIPRVKGHGNGMTVDGGNISLLRRHTKAIGDTEDGLEIAVKEGVKSFLLKAASLDQEIKMLKAIALTDQSAHHIMMIAASKKVVSWASLGKLQVLWQDSPRANAWDIYQAFTRYGMLYPIGKEMQIVTNSRKLILDICDEGKEVIEATELVEYVDNNKEEKDIYHNIDHPLLTMKTEDTIKNVEPRIRPVAALVKADTNWNLAEMF